MSERLSFGKLEVATGPALEETPGRADPQTPFRIVVLGDFSGRASRDVSSPETIAARRPLLVDRDNFQEVLRRLGVEIRLSLAGSPPLVIPFRELDDFLPDAIFERLAVFERLRGLRRRLADRQTFPFAAAELQGYSEAPSAEPPPETRPKEPATSTDLAATQPEGLLDQVLQEAARGLRETDPSRAASPWDALIEKIVRPYYVPKPDPRQAELIASVDGAVGELMRTVLHHPVFQQIEAVWRALYFLVSRLETGTRLKLYVLDVSKAELAADLGSTEDLRSTQTYRLLVEQTVHTPGAAPWAVLSGSYTFDPTRENAQLLGRMAKIAGCAGAPFIAAASPRVLGCESLFRTPDPDDWQSPAEEEDRQAWQSLRRLRESSYLGLALPRFLLRLPYGPDTAGTERFEFDEMPGEPGHEDYLWGNPSFACVYLLAEAFTRHGWSLRPGVIREIDGLPIHVYKSQSESLMKPCAEVLLTDRAAETILQNGCMPLASLAGQGTVRLVRFASLADPPAPLAGRWS